AILRIYENGFTVRHKEDASPVTEADQVAETLILAALGEIAPGVPVVAEEEMEAGREPRVDAGPFFLVDPLDGTKEFVARTGEFTVNIALVERDRPVVGVIHVPVLGETYWT